MKRLRFPLTAIFLLLIASPIFATEETDWQTLQQESRATIPETHSRQEAIEATTQLLDQQENGIRNFLAKHPASSHRVAATLHLAQLRAERSMITGDAEFYESAQRILDELLANPSLTTKQKADVSYAKIALAMRHIRPTDSAAIEQLFSDIAEFRKVNDGDERIPSLLVNAAPLLDQNPARKKNLLEEAKSLTTNDALLREIHDDLHRISLLGQPLDLHFTATDGRKIDVANFRGKLVVISFFAEWSPPSLLEIQQLKTFLAAQSSREIEVIGISLDQNRESLRHIISGMQIEWPIYFDGKSFYSPLIRNLGINSLPTLWILDREGRLVALNSWTNFSATLASLLGNR